VSVITIHPLHTACELCGELAGEIYCDGILACRFCAIELAAPPAPMLPADASDKRFGPPLEDLVDALLQGVQ
jgi:hypothetical protein